MCGRLLPGAVKRPLRPLGRQEGPQRLARESAARQGVCAAEPADALYSRDCPEGGTPPGALAHVFELKGGQALPRRKRARTQLRVPTANLVPRHWSARGGGY